MNIALVLSGGTGTRLGGDIPKQYIEVGGRPVVAYCLETLAKSDKIDGIQMVADSGWHGLLTDTLEKLNAAEKFRGFSEPGENRQLSIWNGLNDIREYAGDGDVVLVHDAARPLLTEEGLVKCLEGLRGHDGVMPVLPMKDTVYYSSDGRTVTKLLDRGCIYAGQAPEAFLLGKYYEANRQLMPHRILEIKGSTEPAIIFGLDIAMIPGDEGNFKITTQSDLAKFRMLAEAHI
ncbi:MAG: 2-C-methyl-D-erythritol 4-phosphate cytidylyltransferase [Blautia sp.]|nr:2-C-methyl-D-erythritol 4-phosphate cytidylyltransferase [Blautia sp.]